MIQTSAGADYLAALQKLDLDPECLFWAEDEVAGQTVLVLVSHQFDRAGPLSLSRLLFQAHNSAATPPAIDPFVVRLHSPDQAIIQQLSRVVGDHVPIASGDRRASSASGRIEGGGLSFEPAWIYKWEIPSKKPSMGAVSRAWRRFADNVGRLAA